MTTSCVAKNMLSLKRLEVRESCRDKQIYFEVMADAENNFDWNRWFQEINTLNSTTIGPLSFEIEWLYNDVTLVDGVEKTMAMLRQPDFNVKELSVSFFNGATIPFWEPVKPWKENLPYLQKLELEHLGNVESVQVGRSCHAPVCTSGSTCACFPWFKLPKLVGWVRVEQLLTLPCLSRLVIVNCRKLTLIPQCPRVSELILIRFNPNLQSIHLQGVPQLKMIEIDNMAWLNSIPKQAFKYLESLKIISDDDKEERFEDITEVFRSCSRSLTELEITGCPRLWSSVVVSRFDHLLALRKLIVKYFDSWPADEQEWQYIKGLQSLEMLGLDYVLTSESIPEWVQFLPALKTLRIRSCPNLSSIPAWMPNLTSLKHLIISLCSTRLEERCFVDRPGPDRPYIQHIPKIFISAFGPDMSKCLANLDLDDDELVELW